MAERILTTEEALNRRNDCFSNNATVRIRGVHALYDSHEALRAERDRLLAERERLVRAIRGVLQSYEGDGDGKPPYFGRPTIKNAWQALDAAIADAQ